MLATSSDFRSLAKILEDLAESQQSSDPELSVTRFKITTLWIPPDKLLVPVEIDILTDIIAAETSTIRHLHLENAFMMLSVAKRMQAFQQLLRSTVCSLADTKPTLQTLHLKEMPPATFPMASICSALRYSRSLKDLHLLWTTDEVPASGNATLLWAWIAFGIFHPDSQAKLGRLNLSGLPLNAEDLAAFASILRSLHPSRQLWILEHGELLQDGGCEEISMPSGQRVFVQLAADKRCERVQV